MRKIVLLALLLGLSIQSWAASKSPLTFDVYRGDENSFNVTATLVYGQSEALLVDTGFTRADALRIAAKIYDSGKSLKTIFISQADPDYYFGAEWLHQFFPGVNIVTTAAVQKAITQNVASKVAYWSPKMETNAPKKPYIPTVITTDSLSVDGVKIEIRGTTGVLAHRPYLWVPSEKAILGNVGIYAGIHV